MWGHTRWWELPSSCRSVSGGPFSKEGAEGHWTGAGACMRGFLHLDLLTLTCSSAACQPLSSRACCNNVHVPSSFFRARPRRGSWVPWAPPAPAQRLWRRTRPRAGRRCPSPMAATTSRMPRTRSGGCTTGAMALLLFNLACRGWPCARTMQEHLPADVCIHTPAPPSHRQSLHELTLLPLLPSPTPAGLRRASAC